VSTIASFKRGGFTWRDAEAGRISGVIKASLIALTRIHIGSGRFTARRTPSTGIELKSVQGLIEFGDVRKLDELLSGALTVRLENVSYGGFLCVPGSTIKGLLRSRLELTPSRHGEALGCIHTASPPIPQPPPPGTHGWRHARIWREAVAEERGQSCNPMQTGDYSLCKICDIFGAPGVAGRVYPSNFCCSACSEDADLPYGEKVIAIKRGSELEGVIAFSGLTLSELGALFVSMGLRSGSIEGKPVLVGKHKYSLKDMGVAKFVVKRFEAPARFFEAVSGFGINCARVGYSVVCEGDELRKLVSRAIDEALRTYPQLEWLYNFSEVERKNEVAG